MAKSIAAAAIYIDGEEPAMKGPATPGPLFQRVDSAMTTDGAAAIDGVRVLKLSEWKEAAGSIAESFRHE